MGKTNLKLILPGLSSWPDLITVKRRRDRRKLFYDGDTISAFMSPSGNKTSEDADTVVVARIFNRAAVEKTIPPCPLPVAGEEKEETNPQNQVA
jgi:hypothetical protein